MREVKLHYSEELLREAVRVFVFRTLVRQLGVMFFVVTAGLVGMLAWLLARHERGWMVEFLAALLLFVVLFMAAVYVTHRRNTIGKFRAMGKPEATLRYDEEQIHFASELGSSSMPWSAIAEVWRHPRFWLLLFSPAQFVTLPLDCLDEQAREFITRKTIRTNA